jgi:uncharacterized membrane protein (Fun14 family)
MSAPSEAASAPEQSRDEDDKATTGGLATTALAAMGGHISVGALLGYSAGYAVKQTLNVVAYLVGVTFVAIQYLSFKGYLTVNWNKGLSEVERALDRDGDGKFGMSDLKIWWQDFVRILTWNMPGGTGFMAGVYYALK